MQIGTRGFTRAHRKATGPISLKLLRLLLAGSITLLSACSAAPEPLDQQLYVWQRQWRTAHADALAQSRSDFSTLRVLALQAHPKAGWARAYPNFDLLREDGRPLVAVIRLDGQLPQLDTQIIRQQALGLVRDWQAAGLRLQGVEIDHDCATARLPAYRELLAQLRLQLPRDLSLSITALPAWLESPQLEQLLEEVDSSVLQVHAVDKPQNGLFDHTQALQWTQQYAERTDKPFYLALPAYGVALLQSTDGATRVESETPLNQPGERRELQAQPQDLAKLHEQLRRHNPNKLRGIIWFRLPLAGDRRAWPLATLLAVARGEALYGAPSLRIKQENGVSEILLNNPGNLSVALPQQINLSAQACEAVDALRGYGWQRSGDGLQFTLKQNGHLAPGAQLSIGWARCYVIDQGTLNAPIF
nr:DUF3142 domain-containing protein [uncultured Pseudomonas sp.]